MIHTTIRGDNNYQCDYCNGSTGQFDFETGNHVQCDTIAILTAERDALKACLKECGDWVGHEPSCRCNFGTHNYPCDCGASILGAKIRSLLGPAPQPAANPEKAPELSKYAKRMVADPSAQIFLMIVAALLLAVPLTALFFWSHQRPEQNRDTDDREERK